MSLSKSKHWYTNNCLHFFKQAVPLTSRLLIAPATTKQAKQSTDVVSIDI